MTTSQNYMIRPVQIEIGWNDHAQGSSFYAAGNTQILCSIFGPKEKSSNIRSQEAELTCTVTRISPKTKSTNISLTFADPSKSQAHATLSTTDMALATERLSTNRFSPFRRTLRQEELDVRAEDTDLSQCVLSALRSAIRGETYQKSSIDIALLILHDDGATFSACVNAATLALANARIEMLSLVVGSDIAITLPASSQPESSSSSSSSSQATSTSTSSSSSAPSTSSTQYLINVDPPLSLSSSALATLSLASLWDVNKFAETASASDDKRTLDIQKANITAMYMHGDILMDSIEEAILVALSTVISTGNLLREALVSHYSSLLSQEPKT